MAQCVTAIDAAGNPILKAAFIMSGRRRSRGVSMSPERETIMSAISSVDTTGDETLDAAIAEAIADITADDAFQDAAVDNAVPAELNSGWTEVRDLSSSRVFYCNNETGDTRLDLPVSNLPVETTVPQEKTKSLQSAATPVSSDQPKDSGSADKKPEDSSASASKDMTETPTTAELPSGWIPTTDPSTSRIYYYNSTTNETSWEIPNNGDSAEKTGTHAPAIVVADDAADTTKEITSESSTSTATAAMSSSAGNNNNEPANSDNTSIFCNRPRLDFHC